MTTNLKRVFAILLLSLAFLWSAQAQAGLGRGQSRQVALVIGNSAYERINALPNARRDAESVSGVLREIGFSVTLLTDATREQMQSALLEFASAASGAQTAVVYFAGAGVEYGGGYHLAPVDVSFQKPQELRLETIALDLAIRATEGASHLRLTIVDADRRGEESFGRDDPLVKQEWRPAAGSNAHVVFSTAPGGVALNGPPGGRSPFAEAVTQMLRRPPLPVDRLFLAIRDQVERATNFMQSPMMYGPPFSGDIFLSAAVSGASSRYATSAPPPPQQAVAPPPQRDPLTPAPAPAQRVALAIGNRDYRSSPLSSPLNDARAMEETLKALGFDAVEVLLDATRQEMSDALWRFAQRAANAETAVFYYSGHGIGLEGVNYLVPVDAQAFSADVLRRDAIPLDDALSAMRSASRLKVAFIDACRDNNFLPAVKGAGKGLAPQPPGIERTIMSFATEPGHVAQDGSGRLSPYTQALIENLKAQPNEDLRMSLSTLGRRVQELARAPQRPRLEHSTDFMLGEHLSLTGARP